MSKLLRSTSIKKNASQQYDPFLEILVIESEGNMMSNVLENTN